MRLQKDFFIKDAVALAPLLLGKILCRRVERGVLRRAITETEAYFGEADTACHASRGKTPRNAVMYEEGGRAYVYLCYGLHNMLNIVAGGSGNPQAVLIRGVAGAPGPGRLTKELSIDRGLNGAVFLDSEEIWLEDGEQPPYSVSPRIGIDYAAPEDRERLWRFVAGAGRGLVHVYTGDGKGKTTAAVGLSARAAGRGRRVLFANFLKSTDSGEFFALENVYNISVLSGETRRPFFFSAEKQEKIEIISEHNDRAKEILRRLRADSCDFLVLDEIFPALAAGAIDPALTDKIIFEKPGRLELVLTGRGAESKYLALADYATEFAAVKHPFEQGVSARMGVEW
ncbi:MAG: DNA-3-methyladenine glycosylase [Clostridiales bacterium]|jgi:DNA-3-methyladenine glycosylase|nr:DNA-3-methyladenine glycosylase [Clostridiales bacterium]